MRSPTWVRSGQQKGSRNLAPQLRQALQDELERVYAIARRNADGALRDHGEGTAADALPNACPYTLDQITADWWRQSGQASGQKTSVIP